MAFESVGRSLADLGEPIQRLLQQIQRNITDEELDMFARIKVRQLAKVYDMLALEEDPERIMTWLKKEHLKMKGIDPAEVNEKRRKKVLAEGGRDPIAYYKEIEKKNIELMKSLEKAQQEREAKRTSNIAERRRRREECQRRALEEKTKQAAMDDSNVIQRMSPGEVSDIIGAFDRFTSKQSTFDNSNSVQDTEWWKRDEYRRDYEKNGVKGSRWTSVVEGGILRAPEPEIQVREEWYRVQCWWKADSHRRNWLASRKAEWWKEEPYIVDWLENGEDGCMWTAADELTGYNRRGNRRKAPKAELEYRVQWYKVNGPKGIVKTWCALVEGSKDHCTVEEKYERDDFYKNGDWWKSEIYVNCVKDNPTECSALHFAGAAAADQEWWKQPEIRADFERGGVLWKAADEESAVSGRKDFATESELSRRESWLKIYWWKAERYIEDYEKNGPTGKLWRETEPGSANISDAVVLHSREEWYHDCRETEWWKGPNYIKDWVDNGDNGLLWTAAWRNAALKGDGKNRDSTSELKRRVEYYTKNFWKQSKYVRDYIAFEEKGTLWKSCHPSAAKDHDWWKSPCFFTQWVLANHAYPADFWKEPDAISDYWKNGADGKQWMASNCLIASLGKGGIDQASANELAVREKYYLKYWWRQKEYWTDYCAKGIKWSAATPEGTGKCSVEERKERGNYFQSALLSSAVLGYQSLTELDAWAPVAGLFASPEERGLRNHYYQTGWWRTRNGLTDYAYQGDKSIYISAASFNDARALKCTRSSSWMEGALRMLYFDSGCVEYNVDTEYIGEFYAAADWWQEPAIISDYLQNGESGTRWKASNSASGTCGLGEKDICSKEEQNYRKTFYASNYWRSLECLQEFQQKGIRGKLWTMSQPRGKGERVDEKNLLLRAQILSGLPEDSWRKNMEANWWKSPEVRADFYANGESGCMVSAANAYVAVEYIGFKSEFKASAAEIKKRVEFYTTYPVSIEDGEKSHYFTLIEPFWITSKSIEDYWVNGSRGKKWRAANAAAFSCSLGDKVTATPAELQRREEVLQALFWRAPAYKEDFLAHGKGGNFWNRTDVDGSGDVIKPAEEVLRISYYMRLSEKYWADCRYASLNWWKAPEVRKDYEINGSRGSLIGAATAAVAVMGLCRDRYYGASEQEKEERINYFKSHPYRDNRVPQALLSRELKRVSAMGDLFWVHHDCIEDYGMRRGEGAVWMAGDATSASTGSAMNFRAKPEDIQLREAFLSKFWWKASKYRLDFLQNGFEGDLWTKEAPNGSGRRAPEDEILIRMCYYASPGLECEKRMEEFGLYWWKSPDSIAHYMVDANNSAYVKARFPQVALSGAQNGSDMIATTSTTEYRNHYMIAVTPTDSAEDITDTQIMAGVNPVKSMWWKNESYQRLYDSQRPLEHWKDPECISDFFKNGQKGRKWIIAGNIFPTNMGENCSKEERKEREVYFTANFWKSIEARNDYELNGLKGTLWTSSEAGGKGKPVSETELSVRMAYYKPSLLWELAIDPETNAESTWCGLHEDILRCEWYEKNWWKCSVGDDYLINSLNSRLLRAASLEIFLNDSVESSQWQISEEEAKGRIAYFEGVGENEWWQNPVVVSDFKAGGEGSIWKARIFKEALLSMGLESPADETELGRRKRWYHVNGWKSSEMIQDYAAGGNKWKTSGSSGQSSREAWMKVHRSVSTEEEARRREWLDHQLSDEQRQYRRAWLLQRMQEARRIHLSELGDLLTQLNDGIRPSDDEIRVIEDAISSDRRDYFTLEGVTQQDFLRAIHTTGFYIGATEEEKLRSEHEALEALQKEEMDRLEEEAAHLAQEALEELEAAGEEYVPFDEAADAEEQEYLNALEEEEAAKINPNEDDVEMEWEAEPPKEEEVIIEAPRDEPQEETKKRQHALEEAFAKEDYGGDIGEEDAEAAEGELDDEVKAALEDVVNNDDWGEEYASEWNATQGEVDGGMPAAHRFVLPLREVPNPQYLKGFFTLMKYTPSTNLINTSQKRIWVVDHFTQCFYNLAKNNRIRKEHAANKMIQLEKNTYDATRLRMMFFDASHSYDMQFVTADERERFYETASAIRSNIRVFAPDLVGPDETESHVTIDGSGANAISVICSDTASKPVKRQLMGECTINASRYMTEPVSIWCGTFDLSGHRPPKSKDDLKHWMPKGKYDIYAVAVQEASYRRQDNEWLDYIQDYLGGGYLPLASMFLWDTMLIVMTKRKNLFKITNVVGSTRGTAYKSACGKKGGIGISIQYLETSICFCTCHLAARNEHCAMRNAILEEIVGNIRLGVPDADITNQFDHVFFFGNFNYRCEVDSEKAESLIQAEKYDELLVYDQFSKERKNEGILYGFSEPAINFAPTYRLNVGSAGYVLKSSPSYCDRVLYKSMPNASVKCTGYGSDSDLLLSEHRPVSATFVVRCVRPVVSCFMKIQKPVPEFIFEDIAVRDYTGSVIKKPALQIFARFASNMELILSPETSTKAPIWRKDTLPPVTSVTQVQEYLETCHILLIILDASEKREETRSRGTGIITLQGCVVGKEDTSINFESDIIFCGKCIGKICGSFIWHALKRELKAK
ncbi:putative Unc104-like kinesin [Trypanosoma grayi]|uniref:putative Unc104-like kinesin n=1 Tax=Trypanosoma grayi TaxID=71804 RepID=UPI0004F420A0|nr:putative Unc104-like kinesin [Trypanosoma grayi]KEG08918.1 putative Unc104-like kinesin [Trypanosoma grayi]